MDITAGPVLAMVGGLIALVLAVLALWIRALWPDPRSRVGSWRSGGPDFEPDDPANSRVPKRPYPGADSANVALEAPHAVETVEAKSVTSGGVPMSDDIPGH